MRRPSDVRTPRHAVADALLPALLAVAAVDVLGVPASLVLVGVALVLGAVLMLGGGG
jgi:hypothetical protein